VIRTSHIHVGRMNVYHAAGRLRHIGIYKCHGRRMRRSDHGCKRATMFRRITAPRQQLLRCSSTDIRVGMRDPHFPHPCGVDERDCHEVARKVLSYSSAFARHVKSVPNR